MPKGLPASIVIDLDPLASANSSLAESFELLLDQLKTREPLNAVVEAGGAVAHNRPEGLLERMRCGEWEVRIPKT